MIEFFLIFLLIFVYAVIIHIWLAERKSKKIMEEFLNDDLLMIRKDTEEGKGDVKEECPAPQEVINNPYDDYLYPLLERNGISS